MTQQYDFNEYGQPLGEAVNNWLPREIPNRLKSLTGYFCQLEPLDIKKHASALHEAFWLNHSSESWTYLPYGPFETLEALQAWMEKIMTQQDTLLYAILGFPAYPAQIGHEKIFFSNIIVLSLFFS